MIYLIIISITFTILFVYWWRRDLNYKFPRILMYHMISEKSKGSDLNKWRVHPLNFERQMKYLHDHKWDVVFMSELIDKKVEELNKTVVITFDDGYMDNFIYAFPILEKYNLKATIYIVPDCNTNKWDSDRNENEKCSLLSDMQIQEMIHSGLIEIGSHSFNHPDLSKIDKNSLDNEIINSRKFIQKKYSILCDSFAFPGGKYNDIVIETVMRAGYTSAVTVDSGCFDINNEKFKAKRIMIDGRDTLLQFILKIKKGKNAYYR